MTLSIFSQLKLMNLKKSDFLIPFNPFNLPHKNFLNEKINQKNKRNSHANGASSIK